MEFEDITSRIAAPLDIDVLHEPGVHSEAIQAFLETQSCYPPAPMIPDSAERGSTGGEAGPEGLLPGREIERRLTIRDYVGRRMGLELHDSVQHLLLALRLSVGQLKRATEGVDHTKVLDDIADTARQIDDEIRTFSYLHYPADLGERGLVPVLRSLARGFGDRTPIEIHFEAVNVQAVTDRAASIALLRVAQEALTNVHRHAHATRVRMLLVERENRLELSIEDNGRGMSRPNNLIANGVGLQGMRFRVEQLGGHFSITRLEQGTKLVATLAIGPQGRHAASTM